MPFTITFMYLNHNGKRAERTVDVDGVEFHSNPGYGYQPGWFISGFCRDKQARRSFALSRVELPEGIGSGGYGNRVYALMILGDRRMPVMPEDVP